MADILFDAANLARELVLSSGGNADIFSQIATRSGQVVNKFVMTAESFLEVSRDNNPNAQASGSRPAVKTKVFKPKANAVPGEERPISKKSASKTPKPKRKMN